MFVRFFVFVRVLFLPATHFIMITIMIRKNTSPCCKIQNININIIIMIMIMIMTLMMIMIIREHTVEGQHRQNHSQCLLCSSSFVHNRPSASTHFLLQSENAPLGTLHVSSAIVYFLCRKTWDVGRGQGQNFKH